MIVVTLTYKKPLTEVDAVLKEHIAFLDHYGFVAQRFEMQSAPN